MGSVLRYTTSQQVNFVLKEFFFFKPTFLHQINSLLMDHFFFHHYFKVRESRATDLFSMLNV